MVLGEGMIQNPTLSSTSYRSLLQHLLASTRVRVLVRRNSFYSTLADTPPLLFDTIIIIIIVHGQHLPPALYELFAYHRDSQTTTFSCSTNTSALISFNQQISRIIFRIRSSSQESIDLPSIRFDSFVQKHTLKL